MAYNILGINPFHNGSACVLSDGEVIEYIEEERLTKKKYDELPFKSISYFLKKYNIDLVAIGGLNQTRVYSNYFKEEIIGSFLQKLGFNSNQIYYLDTFHHKTHVSTAFYNSGFKKAIGIVIDGGGSNLQNNKIENNSIFLCSYPSDFPLIYESPLFFDPHTPQSLGIGQSFERLCDHLGFRSLDAGKTNGVIFLW
jgi:predicted NodU family carbamoyl transferase